MTMYNLTMLRQFNFSPRCRFKRRMNLELETTCKFDPAQKYIFGLHPHGIIPWGAVINMITNVSDAKKKARWILSPRRTANPSSIECRDLGPGRRLRPLFPHSADCLSMISPLFPQRPLPSPDFSPTHTRDPEQIGLDLHVMAASFCFYVPIYRDLLLGGGISDAARIYAEKFLAEGKSIAVFPGGATEALYARPGGPLSLPWFPCAALTAEAGDGTCWCAQGVIQPRCSCLSEQHKTSRR